MNAIRGAAIVAGVTIYSAWLVGICVRAGIGAPDASPQFAGGPLPAAPPSIAPLVVPARDPFAADVVGNSPTKPPSGIAGGGDLGSVDVPDVASFASTNGLGVVATIVGHDESYALVEDGAAVHVVHPGDAFGASTVTEIAVDHILLGNGKRIAMVNRSSPTISSPQNTGAGPSPSATLLVSEPAAEMSATMVPAHAPTIVQPRLYKVQLPTGSVVAPQPGIGVPPTLQPNGSAALSFGASIFPTSLASPPVVPIDAAIFGGSK